MNNYYDMKQGRCSQLEYFKSNYKGSVVEVSTKRVKTKLKHRFFVIKNAMLDYDKHKYTEIKLYDIDGLIHKEKLQEPANRIDSKKWFDNLIRYGIIGDYLSLLVDREQE